MRAEYIIYKGMKKSGEEAFCIDDKTREVIGVLEDTNNGKGKREGFSPRGKWIVL